MLKKILLFILTLTPTAMAMNGGGDLSSLEGLNQRLGDEEGLGSKEIIDTLIACKEDYEKGFSSKNLFSVITRLAERIEPQDFSRLLTAYESVLGPGDFLRLLNAYQEGSDSSRTVTRNEKDRRLASYERILSGPDIYKEDPRLLLQDSMNLGFPGLKRDALLVAERLGIRVPPHLLKTPSNRTRFDQFGEFSQWHATHDRIWNGGVSYMESALDGYNRVQGKMNGSGRQPAMQALEELLGDTKKHMTHMAARTQSTLEESAPSIWEKEWSYQELAAFVGEKISDLKKETDSFYKEKKITSQFEAILGNVAKNIVDREIERGELKSALESWRKIWERRSSYLFECLANLSPEEKKEYLENKKFPPSIQDRIAYCFERNESFFLFNERGEKPEKTSFSLVRELRKKLAKAKNKELTEEDRNFDQTLEKILDSYWEKAQSVLADYESSGKCAEDRSFYVDCINRMLAGIEEEIDTKTGDFILKSVALADRMNELLSPVKEGILKNIRWASWVPVEPREPGDKRISSSTVETFHYLKEAFGVLQEKDLALTQAAGKKKKRPKKKKIESGEKECEPGGKEKFEERKEDPVGTLTRKFRDLSPYGEG